MNASVTLASLPIGRRKLIAASTAILLSGRQVEGRAHPASAARTSAPEPAPEPAPEARWYRAAAEMKRHAESWGDQPYGAVLVFAGALIGEGPSRVIKNQDSDAHAEREAIRDAQRRLGRQHLGGSVLYSTARPCGLCQAAAAQAGISRMYFGPSLTDAGVPGQMDSLENRSELP